MALINEADLMIDNDSGPAHISAALKIPTVVLVGADYKNAYRDKDIYQKNHVFLWGAGGGPLLLSYDVLLVPILRE